jgi:hypothetical protein
MNIDRKYDPSPEENRAAIAAIQAKIECKSAKLYDAKLVDYPIGNSVLVEATAEVKPSETYRIIVATISKNFIGEDQARELAEKTAKYINRKPVGV